MAIRYLDEQPQSRRIRYLDDSPEAKETPQARLERIKDEPGIQDATVSDGSALIGMGGLAKGGANLAVKGAGALVESVPSMKGLFRSKAAIGNEIANVMRKAGVNVEKSKLPAGGGRGLEKQVDDLTDTKNLLQQGVTGEGPAYLQTLRDSHVRAKGLIEGGKLPATERAFVSQAKDEISKALDRALPERKILSDQLKVAAKRDTLLKLLGAATGVGGGTAIAARLFRD